MEAGNAGTLTKQYAATNAEKWLCLATQARYEAIKTGQWPWGDAEPAAELVPAIGETDPELPTLLGAEVPPAEKDAKEVVLVSGHVFTRPE